MSIETDQTLGEKALKIIDEGAETMWRNALADIVLELFERDGTITRSTLKEETANRIANDSYSRIERATLQGALKALDGNPPS